MLIISDNLKGLVRELGVCPVELVEEFSIKINLDRSVRRMRGAPLVNKPVKFMMPFDPVPYFEDEHLLNSDLVIDPQQNVLACSSDIYTMPNNCFGLVQTKGSLARLFVSTTANDGQIEPGYRGKITLEISNHATFQFRYL
jgi:dCTP deaminase